MSAIRDRALPLACPGKVHKATTSCDPIRNCSVNIHHMTVYLNAKFFQQRECTNAPCASYYTRSTMFVGTDRPGPSPSPLESNSIPYLEALDLNIHDRSFGVSCG